MLNNRRKIFDLIRANAKNRDKAALQLSSGEMLTYCQLFLLTEQTDAAIRDFKIKPHERIALISDYSLVYIPLMLAVMENAACVPLDTEFTLEQYLDYFPLLSIDYLLCDRTQQTAMDAAVKLGIGIIQFSPDEAAHPMSLRFMLKQRSNRLSRQPLKNDETVFVFTTSGTTSTPKIVPRLYHHVFETLLVEAAYLDMHENAVHLVAVQLSRFPTIWYTLKILMTNGILLYTDGMHPKRIADIMQSCTVDYLLLPPAGLFALYEYTDQTPIIVKAENPVKILVYGAPLPHQLKTHIEQRLYAQLIDIYGMTEIGISTSPYKAPRGYREGSVGCPVAQEITILDSEIVVRGIGVFAGYENNPELNHESFIDGWFRTGDTGYIDEDGYLFITGRIRELINRGGEKVSPYEIEAAIKSLGRIRDVSVFPFPNQQGSDDVGAVIVPDPGFSLCLRELRAVLKDRIKPYKLPTILYTMKEIPTSEAGKVQRNMLYQHLNRLNLVPETLIKTAAPAQIDATPLQRTILDIWQNILDQPYIELDDEFFDLGGDSLDAAEIIAALESCLEKVISIDQFFQCATVRQLAELMEKAPRTVSFSHIAPIRPEGDKAPLFLVHALSGEVVTYQHLAKHIDPRRPVYGLNLNYQKEQWDAATTIHDIAKTYAAEVQAFQPEGPCYLGGFSMGGAIAFEIARLLQQCRTTTVILLDTSSGERVHRKRSALLVVKDLLHAKLNKVRTTPATAIPGLVLGKIKPFCGEAAFNVQLKTRSYDPEELNQRLRSKYGDGQSEIQKNMVLLKHIYKTYQPSFFPGKIYFFRAAKRNDKAALDYWRPMAEEMVLIEKDYHHMDFVSAQYAADTAREINQILTRQEA